jgi:O-antigen/teichoic acid export membrane protein
MLWVAVEKFSVQAGQLVIGIVLARLLVPEDYGLIGMLSIFLAISQSFVDSGMGSGLIQKKDRTDVDFSTVFVFNFLVSAAFYMGLFFAAPLIANFYNEPRLVLLTKVITLTIIINSLAIVQRTRLIIDINFKTIAKVNAVSVFAGGMFGISFAYMGFGVWALVIQTLTRTSISVVLFWFFSKWRPSLLFSKESFRRLFGFGSKLLIAGIYAQSYKEIYNVAIGKAYSVSDLGFYTRAKGFAEMAAGTITSIMKEVTYPILSSLQDDRIRLISVYSRIIRMTAFIVFPTMAMLALLADPLIRLLLTDKWLPVVPLLQWMCFARIFYPIGVINMNILNAVGRSDLFLKVDLSKLPLLVLALVITIPLGVKAMVIGHVVTSFLAFFINAYLPGRLFGYGGFSQIRDMMPIIFSTILTACTVLVVLHFIEMLMLKLLIGSVTGMVSYLTISYFLKISELNELMSLLLKIRK